MRRFLIKILGFITIISLVLLSVLIYDFYKIPDTVGYNYYGCDPNKPNRMILVGSSNVYYNYDYSALNNGFKDYDVLGAQLSISSGFMPLVCKLNRLNVKENDIVVFCLPYELYSEGYFVNFFNEQTQKIISKELVYEAFRYDFFQATKNLSELTMDHFLDVFDKNERINPYLGYDVKYFKERDNLKENTYYSNCFPDPNGNFHVNSLDFDESYLRTFFEKIRHEVKAKVYFRLPVLREGFYEVNNEKVSFILKQARYLNDFETAKFDSAYWSDHKYHLNQCGTEINTELLIKELGSILKD